MVYFLENLYKNRRKHNHHGDMVSTLQRKHLRGRDLLVFDLFTELSMRRDGLKINMNADIFEDEFGREENFEGDLLDVVYGNLCVGLSNIFFRGYSRLEDGEMEFRVSFRLGDHEARSLGGATFINKMEGVRHIRSGQAHLKIGGNNYHYLGVILLKQSGVFEVFDEL